MGDCLWRLKVVDSVGFFMRGEKGKTIQTAVWILKTSAADAKDTQKGFTSVASRRVGGDWFAFRKGNFFLFLKKTFSLGCIEDNSLRVLSGNIRKFSEAVMTSLPVLWSEPRGQSEILCLPPRFILLCLWGWVASPHLVSPQSRQHGEEPSGQTDRQEAPGTSHISPRTFKKHNVLCQSELICLFFSKRCWSNTFTTLDCRSFVVQRSNVKLPKKI